MIREFNSAEQSSTIHSSSYDTETRLLTVHFKHGVSYIYKQVPLEKYEEFELAESKGTAFRNLFYNIYEYTKLTHAV
jgi:hypothetical protein